MNIPAEFHPELLSRRGELTAWGLTILAVVAWLALRLGGLRVSWIFILVAVFLLIGALASSLSNWVDRHTVLRLELGGVSFENGLRQVEIAYHRIPRVQVLPIQLGNLVRVYGDNGQYFSFHTYGEVGLRGRRGRVGFKEGEQILAHILERSRLKQASNPQNQAGVIEYTR